MTNKQIALINELQLYIPFDNRLSENDKEQLLSLDCNLGSSWAKVVYDYFYSHLDENGNPISLNGFLTADNSNAGHYKKVEKEFIDNLFSIQPPLFFFDVDNTFTDRGYLSQEKIDFVKNFAEKHRIILTTGKTYDSIKPVIDACNLNGNYASCLNGSVLVSNGEFTILEKVGGISENIVKHFENAPFDTVVYYEDYIRLIKPLSKRSLQHLERYTEKYSKEEKIDYNRVVKVLFFIFDDEPDRQAKEDLVINYVKSQTGLVCMRTSESTYEILKSTQHKGNTVKIISQLKGKYYRSTIGVGDSMNDAGLLSHVGKPYVVSTASSELKQLGYDLLEKNRNVDIVNLIKKYTRGEEDE